MIPKLNGTETAIVFALAVGAGVVGYALSEADKRKLGRTPWGLPSVLWALFFFLSWLIGLVLYLFAHRAEVRRAAQGPGATFDTHGRFVPTAPPASSRSAADFPAYPRPATGGERVATAPIPLGPSLSPDVASDRLSPPARPATPAPPAGPATAASAVPPSWQVDPSGRYHYRWWTGTEWTSYVSTQGQVVVDASPDQRIGPY